MLYEVITRCDVTNIPLKTRNFTLFIMPEGGAHQGIGFLTVFATEPDLKIFYRSVLQYTFQKTVAIIRISINFRCVDI